MATTVKAPPEPHYLKVARGCTIVRRFTRTHLMLNPTTGEARFYHTEIIVERCGHSLFGDRERETLVCRSCHAGFEKHAKPETGDTTFNIFESEAERERAAAAIGKEN